MFPGTSSSPRREAAFLHRGDDDGIPDDEDDCPNSDTSPTIVIGGVDTGIVNDPNPLGDGCSINDLIALTDSSTGEVVQALVAVKGEGGITGQELGAILKAMNAP